jgi:uncharacterized alkaline shock family protein YloU/adenylate kinase family enzyme
MKVYALVGPSGSGKSHRARIVAHEHNIPLIIDDGLLIWDRKILAGKTAKREETKIGAIKTALFYDQDLVEEVRKGIEYSGEDKVLILGTSLGMVERIISKLQLPDIDKLINIEHIASEEEMNKAKGIRRKEGKHVIPVPKIEVKSQLPGYIIDVLEIFKNGHGDESIKQESSIMRPKFSFRGDLIIYNKVIKETVKHHMEKFDSTANIKNINIDKNDLGLKISFSMEVKYGIVIHEYISKLQNSLKRTIEIFTGIEVLDISIKVNSLFIGD